MIIHQIKEWIWISAVICSGFLLNLNFLFNWFPFPFCNFSRIWRDWGYPVFYFVSCKFISSQFQVLSICVFHNCEFQYLSSYICTQHKARKKQAWKWLQDSSAIKLSKSVLKSLMGLATLCGHGCELRIYLIRDKIKSLKEWAFALYTK